jgi:hypothetical protein
MKAVIKDLIENATSIETEEPEPLLKESSQPCEFPIEECPALLRNAILGLNDKIQAPMAICAQSVLAVANLAVQGHVNIKLPFGQIRPISCLFLTIADSGDRKTSCDNEIIKYIEQHEDKLRENYKQKYNNWKNDLDAWESQRKKILSGNKSSDRSSKKLALDMLGAEPMKPLDPILTCTEPTFEGLCKLMITGQPSIGIFSSEGGQFIGGHSMKDENKIRTATALSDLWDGKPIKRIRSGDGAISLPGRRLCIHLMVQPKIAANFLSDDQLRDQGLLSRILAVSPLSTVGTRFCHTVSEESISAIEAFGEKILDILELPLLTKENCENELTPRTLTFDNEAAGLFNEFTDYIETRIIPEGHLETIKGLANKLPEHAARIASMFALIENIQANIVSYKHLKMGICIAKYYGEEALRLVRDGKTNPDIALAEKVRVWLEGWDDEMISLPDIYQGLGIVRDKGTAFKVAAILEDHGWLSKLQKPGIVKGVNRKMVWKIIRKEKK